MDVQILLYSYSGHTLALIEQLRVQLETLGITYQIIDISKVESSDVLLVSRKILIATPIQRFALSQNMNPILFQLYYFVTFYGQMEKEWPPPCTYAG